MGCPTAAWGSALVLPSRRPPSHLYPVGAATSGPPAVGDTGRWPADNAFSRPTSDTRQVGSEGLPRSIWSAVLIRNRPSSAGRRTGLTHQLEAAFSCCLSAYPATMIRRLSRWLAPLVCRILAPEATNAEYLEQLRTGDRGDRLLNASATWFAVLVLAGVAEIALLPLINVSSVCDRLSGALNVIMFLCLIPLCGYGAALAVEDRRARRRQGRRGDSGPRAQDR